MVNIGIDAPAALNALLASDEFKAAMRPMDLPALLSLQNEWPRTGPERLAQLASAGWFRDGMTTAEAAIVAVLYERSGSSRPSSTRSWPTPVPSTWNLEPPLTGAGRLSPIAIVRSGPAPVGTPVMAVAETAVPVFETMFDAEFPTPAIVFQRNRLRRRGSRRHELSDAHHTVAQDRSERPAWFRPHAVYHEIAHYFLYAEPYCSPKAAPISPRPTPVTAPPALPWNRPTIPATRNVPERTRTAGAGRSRGSSSRPRIVAVQLLPGRTVVAVAVPATGRGTVSPGLARAVRQAGGRPLLSVAARFHRDRYPRRVAPRRRHADAARTGTHLGPVVPGTSRHRGGRNARSNPVDPTLPTVNGRVDQAYVALSVEGEPVDTFSASDVEVGCT